MDDPKDWHDSDAEFYDCEWYAQGTNCRDYGDFFRNFGKTANEACCACGGGSTGGGGPSPSPPPGPSPCPSGQKLLEVEVTTDDFGSEDNVFRVKKKENGKWTNIWKENNFEDNTTESFERCLPVAQCYKFVMVDFFENGMCCEDGQGGYKLTWGGKYGTLLLDVITCCHRCRGSIFHHAMLESHPTDSRVSLIGLRCLRRCGDQG